MEAKCPRCGGGNLDQYPDEQRTQHCFGCYADFVGTMLVSAPQQDGGWLVPIGVARELEKELTNA